MPDFMITSPDGQQYRVSGPEGSTEQEALAHLQSNLGAAPASSAEKSPVMDFIKSIPRGMVTGLTSVPNSSMVPIGDELDAVAPTRQQSAETLKAPLPEPQGMAGRFGAAVGEGLGNPLSYVGPGGPLLKVGGSVLSSIGGEAGKQAAEGTPLAGPAQIAGSLAGGAAAVKGFGAGVPKAATPTKPELIASADRGYSAARQSGLELQSSGVSDFASQVEQKLIGPDHGFTGGQYGTAPKTLDVLSTLQKPPADAVVTASNIDTVRKRLGHIAGERVEGKPTPDAKAATLSLNDLKNYTENLPQNHILAGNAEDYVRATKQANGDYAAAMRLGDFDARLNKAQNATDRQIAGSLDAQIKSKAGALLDNAKQSRGLNDAERAQLQLINSGGPISNTLRQLGRGGAGVIPMAAHLGTAVATGGSTLPLSLGIGLPLFAARKASEKITVSRANALAEMLAKRSPEYSRRQKELPAPDLTANQMQMLRSFLSGTR